MKLDLVDKITSEQLRDDIPDFKPGADVKVYVRIKEGDKSRIQIFEGVVTSITGGGISKNFTVRKMSGGVGVERTFPIHSPILEKVEVTRQGKVRRAKLNYLRGLSSKNARIKEDR
jgi:large subunit ribosomal protein L19